jgi:DNA-binding MarR family transcriptional regulator
MFTLIFAGDEGGQPLSASQIAELTGHDTSQLARLLRKLIDRDLIERRPGPGRGAPQLLYVKHSPASKKLIAVMTKR